MSFSIHTDLAAVEPQWRAFEQQSDGTAFQSFAWLSAWLRYVGAHRGVRPVIVIGRRSDGAMAFLLPLSVETGFARRLRWLGSDLSDYNAPLLAPAFSQQANREHFIPLWDAIVQQIQGHPDLKHDLVHFEKMPSAVGAQPNPFMHLDVAKHPSGAHQMQLTGDWETFYAAKRSSSTRKRDRYKRKKLADFGPLRLVTPDDAHEVRSTVNALMKQKAASFAAMGVENVFAEPGRSEFFRALAADPTNRSLVHVSRLDIGDTPVAINLGLVFNGRYYHVLCSYSDGEASRFGPGAAHLHDIMRYAIERQCSVFDFTIGDEDYKRDWCETELTLFDHIEAKSLRGAVVSIPLLGKRALKRSIKQNPALWSAATRLRETTALLRAPAKLR